MAAEFRIKIDDAGRASIVDGGGGVGAAPASRPAATKEASPQEIRQEAEAIIAQRRHSTAVQAEVRQQEPGLGGVRGFMATPMGAGISQAMSAMMDPLASGAGQQAAAASALGRTGSMTAAQPAIQSAGMISTTAGDEAARFAEITANAVGEAIERSMQRRTMTEGAATRTVQGVAAGLARAGVDVASHEDDFRRLLSRQAEQERLAYDAMTQVAQWSGNQLGGGAVAAVGRGADEAAQATLGQIGLGIEPYEEIRQAATQQKQANRATKGR